MKFIYGFIYKEVTYGWFKMELYRLPFVKNKRSYSLIKVPFYFYKTTVVYNIQRNKITLNRLKLMTKEINIKIEIIQSDDCPF